MSNAAGSAPVIIKRYARGRLCDAARGQHVSAGTLRFWQLRGIAFTVLDAGDGVDVTRVLMA